mgnify:CR=1 FL=1|jgi:hypothetical protein
MSATISPIPTLSITQLTQYVNLMGTKGMAKHNLLLLGAHGIGKSEIAKSIFANHPDFEGYEFHTLYLSQMADPGDLTGLPKINPKTGLMEFVPPYWWNSEKPIILLVDEILRARLELIQPFFSLALDKEIAGRKLHPDSVIISCANFGAQYQQTDADVAFGSRFAPFHFLPTVEEWIDHAVESKVDRRIVGFIRENKSMLDDIREDDNDMEFYERTPDRRAWFRVADILSRHGSGKIAPNSISQIAISGEIGVGATIDFMRYANSQSGLTPEMVLMADDFSECVNELEMLPLQDLIHLSDRMVDHIKGDDNIQVKKHKPTMNLVSVNVINFIEWCESSKNEEVTGNFFTRCKKEKKTVGFLFRVKEFMELAERAIRSVLA